MRLFQYSEEIVAAGTVRDRRRGKNRAGLNPCPSSHLLLRKAEALFFHHGNTVVDCISQGCRSDVEGCVHIGMCHEPAVRAFKTLAHPPPETPAAAAAFRRIFRIDVDYRNASFFRPFLDLSLQRKERSILKREHEWIGRIFMMRIT